MFYCLFLCVICFSLCVSFFFCVVLFFFFKQKTAYEMRISDWSSDVCSSDLPISFQVLRAQLPAPWRQGRYGNGAPCLWPCPPSARTCKRREASPWDQ